MIGVRIFLIGTIFFLLSCANRTKTKTIRECRPLVVSDSLYSLEKIEVQVDSVEVKDNCMVVYFDKAYPVTEFVVPARFRKTSPPRLSGHFIQHKEKVDPKSTFSVNLQPLQGFSRSGLVFLHIDGYAEPIEYRFVKDSD